MRSILITFLIITLSSVFSQDITVPELKQHVYFLADDSLEGRLPGTKGGLLAAEYIRDEFKSYGLQLPGDNGFQYFEVVTSARLGENNSFRYSNFEGKVKTEFMPFSYSENGSLAAPVVFTGYGFSISHDSLKWDDYLNMDVKGKWVMILLGDPEVDNPSSLFANYSDSWGKILEAKDHGASGVLFVTPVKVDKNDVLEEFQLEKSTSRAGIPVIHISRQLANGLLAEQNQTIETLEEQLNTTRRPGSFYLATDVAASVDVVYEKTRTQNVVAMLPGSDPVLMGEYIVIGAHYDHLGMGGPGSNSRAVDTVAVHNGADDNASGVAGLLEIAEELAMNREQLKRTIIFVAFDAEEMGLLGSKFFVEQFKDQILRIEAMINLDMIGRFVPEDEPLLIGGTGTSLETETILNDLALDLDFKLTYSPEGFGASDHSSFYAKDVPVFFITSGAHEDYHMPQDDADRILYEGTKQIAEFTYDLVLILANRDQSLTFQEAGPRERPRSGRGFKVTLGIMPDFASAGNNGLRVDAVRIGGPAEAGGMLKGDVIVGVNGKSVTNVYDYMARLKELETGQTVAVEVIRNGEKQVLIVQL